MDDWPVEKLVYYKCLVEKKSLKIDWLSERPFERLFKIGWLINSKLYGVNATIIIFVFVLYCIVLKRFF